MTLCGCEGNGQTVGSGNQPDSKPAVKTDEQFTLKMNESKKIKNADIEITVIRIGRKWTDKSESLDFAFSVKHGGKIEIFSSPLPDSITAGKYKIEVIKTEPFGEGYAIFLVKKDDPVEKTDSKDAAAKFVERFGWHIDDSVAPQKVPIDFPKNFDGLPFYHYQSASQRSGVDMTPLLGRKREMLKYTLREKRSDNGQNFTVYAHLIIENDKVVGAWQTDSSSRAPGIYSFGK